MTRHPGPRSRAALSVGGIDGSRSVVTPNSPGSVDADAGDASKVTPHTPDPELIRVRRPGDDSGGGTAGAGSGGGPGGPGRGGTRRGGGSGGGGDRVDDGAGGVGGIRIKILASYLALLVLSGILSAVAIREVLAISLDSRVRDALGQEVRELDRLLVNGVDIRTGERFTGPEAAFDTFLSRNVPSNDEALLVFVDGRLYASALSRFPLARVPDEAVERFAVASAATGPGIRAEGEFDTELGVAYYRSLGVQIGDREGLFVVAILPVEEREQITTLQLTGTAAVLAALLLAAVASWLVVNRTLVPVRQLTNTARQISESDLTGRIEVRGGEEAAEMARTFNSMLDRLEVIVRTERDFVRDASHELRVPLTVCLGNLELLGEGLPSDEAGRNRVIALAIDEVERMSRIVEDLRLLADSPHSDFLQPERIELAGFTAELAGKARALASREWEVDAVGDSALYADRHRLTEAVMNLVDNAVQHTVVGDRIAIGTAIDGDEVRIWVRDTGVGVPVADQARIFDRFCRGSFATRRYRGSGLGLAIVRAVAEAHGGRVELASMPGTGATFTIVMPG